MSESTDTAFQVIARRWRPQVFQNVVGQGHIAQTLLNALRSGRVPHALLFTGPRGTGKTSTARILAKALRCPNAVDFVPCQQCRDCTDTALGRSIDVIEIDGASNNGVDSVRELRDSVGYSPTSGTYKIYIVDEVHMLSTSAFNALLKTLEEPPPHVVFILATTEAQKIPNTILSRCQRFDFRMISQKEITQHLAHICKTDGVNFDEEALWLIARQAKGSMRDSQSLLDQIITFSEGQITVQKVTESLGLIQREIINRALQAIFTRQISGVAEVISLFNASGSDPSLFAEDLLEQLRNSLMIKIGAHKMNVPVDLPDSELRLLEEWTKEVSQEDIHLLFDITLKGSQHLARAIEPRLALEMLLFKLASAPQVQSLARLLDASLPPSGGPAPIPEVRPPRPAMGGQSLKAAPAPKATSAPQPPPPAAPAAATPPSVESVDGNLNALTPKEEPKDPWHRFVESVRASNGLLAALLEHTFILEQTATTLKLGLPEKMAFLMSKLQDPKNKERLQSFIESYWKQKPAVEIVLAKPGAEPQTVVEKSQKAESDKKALEREQVENHPMIKKAQSLFKTEIVAIKEEKRQ